jgi:peptide-methionine (S)-S-oxide reductase
METATLAGGCFWCLEAAFGEIRGVESVLPGYSGGDVPNPSYKDVCNGSTGHAEAVQVRFSRAEVSYKDVLEVFFAIHDPTTLNRQGADVGPQYRSAIFYHGEEQKLIAENVITAIDKSKIWENPVVTEVTPYQNFYEAEDFHHDYYSKHGHEPYCRLVIEPKIGKLRKHFTERLKKR